MGGYYFVFRVIDYYAEHILKCGDTYDRERGVVQLPRVAKVNKCRNRFASFNACRKRLALLIKSILKILT